jgi:PII-like signaling protein
VTELWKLTSCFGERQRHRGRLLADAVLETFEEHALATSLLLRAAAGFGLRHHLRTDETLTMSEDPSMVAVAVDDRARLEPVVDRVLAMQDRGLVTVERLQHFPDVPDSAEVKLTVHLGRDERIGGGASYVAACELLRQHGVAGASVVVGVDGTSRGRRERARFFARNRSVPAMVVAVGSSERIRVAVPELQRLLPEAVVTVERVRICKRDGALLAGPRGVAGTEAWQRLTVYTSEHHLVAGEPVHRAIVRRLRAGDSRGVTVLRGAWGFHGEHAPHGDRFWQLGRRVPVVTTLVDTPDRVARAFAVVDELTVAHGLVTTELVPRAVSPGADR